MQAWHMLLSCVCLSAVHHKPVFYQNDLMNRADFWHESFLLPILHFLRIQLSPKVTVIPSGALSQTLDLENSATAS